MTKGIYVDCESEIIDYIEKGGKNLWEAIIILAKWIDKKQGS